MVVSLPLLPKDAKLLSYPVFLDEPFQAEFLNFDSATITVRTDKYPCLRINISDLENIVPFNPGIEV